MDAYDALTTGLVEGMRIVGIDFRDGILFVPEVLLAASAMKPAWLARARASAARPFTDSAVRPLSPKWF